MKLIMEIEITCQINTLLTLLEGSLSRVESSMVPELHMEHIFLYCLSWSLGGVLHESDRYAFDSTLRSTTLHAMPSKVLNMRTPEGPLSSVTKQTQVSVMFPTLS